MSLVPVQDRPKVVYMPGSSPTQQCRDGVLVSVSLHSSVWIGQVVILGQVSVYREGVVSCNGQGQIDKIIARGQAMARLLFLFFILFLMNNWHPSTKSFMFSVLVNQAFSFLLATSSLNKLLSDAVFRATNGGAR